MSSAMWFSMACHGVMGFLLTKYDSDRVWISLQRVCQEWSRRIRPTLQLFCPRVRCRPRTPALSPSMLALLSLRSVLIRFDGTNAGLVERMASSLNQCMNLSCLKLVDLDFVGQP